MAASIARLSDTAMLALLQPLLQPGEVVVGMADGHASPLEPHDGLTMAVHRLTGRWQPQAVVVALTDSRLHWLDLTLNGAVACSRAYRLPLKGRLVLQQRGVLERQFPGEARVFLRLADPDKATELYRRIDEGQTAMQRDHGHVPEVVGVGVKPARHGMALEPGPHGETTVAQHEMVHEIRPNYRPSRLDV